MKEDFLSYIWTFQKFNKTNLRTTKKLSLNIKSPGFVNHNSGQDFSEARIIIDGIEWAGNIELHIKTSDWNLHNHQNNRAYNNTILHVVWHHDEEILTQEGNQIPVLELKQSVDKSLIEKYDLLLSNLKRIPCEDYLPEIPVIIKNNQTTRSLFNRLERKAVSILESRDKKGLNWQEITYQLLATNFGFKVNATPFLRLSEKLPLKILQKHANNLLQIEALLFGVSGFLNKKSNNEYYLKLYKEYQFLKHKYKLDESGTLEPFEWKFLRLRPHNFPTLRLAQFAAFISKNNNPFNTFILSPTADLVIPLFKNKTSTFWEKHYHFDHETEQVGTFGKSSIENIIINTVAPLLIAYAISKDSPQHKEKALRILDTLPKENNRVTRTMENLGFENSTATDSQALIELHNETCLKKKCLECSIGNQILNKC